VVCVLIVSVVAHLLIRRLSLRRSGLKTRHVTAGKLVLSYADRGQRRPGHASLVFVHGLASSKDNWSSIVAVRAVCCCHSLVISAMPMLLVEVKHFELSPKGVQRLLGGRPGNKVVSDQGAETPQGMPDAGECPCSPEVPWIFKFIPDLGEYSCIEVLHEDFLDL